MSLDVNEELVKVRDVLGSIWAKLPHSTETEATALAADIAAIGPQPEPLPGEGEPTADEIAAELARRNAEPVKSLADMTEEELQAELAKRQGQ